MIEYLPHLLILIIWGLPCWLSFIFIFYWNESDLPLATIIMMNLTFFLNNAIVFMLLAQSISKFRNWILKWIKKILNIYLISASLYIAYILSSNSPEFNLLFSDTSVWNNWYNTTIEIIIYF